MKCFRGEYNPDGQQKRREARESDDFEGRSSTVANPEKPTSNATHNSGSSVERNEAAPAAALPDVTVMRRRERELLRSILWFPEAKWGPNVSIAIAYMPEMAESGDNADKIAEAILQVVVTGRQPTMSAVCDRLQPHQARIVINLVDAVSQPDPLPLSIQETEAIDMIAYYKGKSLWRLVAQAEQKMRANFADAAQLASELKEELEKSL